MRRCRGCGCTDLTPCVLALGGPCCWVGEDLCSGCVAEPPIPFGEDEDGEDDGFQLDEGTGLWLPPGSYDA